MTSDSTPASLASAETTAPPGPPAPSDVPRATYRFQLHGGFGFDDAAALVPYLARLGISHVYASPFLAARAGSPHGYDIVDHNRINPELGGEEAFFRFSDRLREHGLGLILDFVPNHVGIGQADNAWWLDVLEWGRESLFARFFDIDWDPAEPSLRNKVLVPFLGSPYGDVLTRGEIKLRLDRERGSIGAWYFEHLFPIAPRHYGTILNAAAPGDEETVRRLRDLAARFARIGRGSRDSRRQAVIRQEAQDAKTALASLVAELPVVGDAIERQLDRLDGTPGDDRSFRELHRLLERQNYRIAYWRVATDEINYRRFFDINDLAGLRIEDAELFELSHSLVFRLLTEGRVQGIRLDHVDGLLDPAAYCRQLQARAAYLGIGERRAMPPEGPEAPKLDMPVYLVVEKILAGHERLREDWQVAGTTGYEFMTSVNGLFVDPASEGRMTETYERFSGDDAAFEDVEHAARHQIVRYNLASEVTTLAGMLYRIAGGGWTTRDYSLNAIRLALIEVLAHFPVYRTYVTDAPPQPEDRRDIEWAVGRARRSAAFLDDTVFDFLKSVLLTELSPGPGSRVRRAEVRRVARKFQQVSGPVAAKAVEDTAFYRYARLISLNEVGGSPARWSTSVAAFHRQNQDRLKRHPHGMLTTATHDHKRGEDMRLRINALSEMPEEWARRVRRWSRLNQSRRADLDDGPAPRPGSEYLLYQTLVGSWPLTDRLPADYAERIDAYMLKASREAKARTSWARPDEAYEQAMSRFVKGVLDLRSSRAFLAELADLVAAVAPAATLSGLAQTALRLTVPGVPDTYQGAEFWDLSLVDPDNRRPVDWAARTAALDAVAEADPAELLNSWGDGRVKQLVMVRLLALRRSMPTLFANGSYVPGIVEGAAKDHVVGFRRVWRDTELIVVVPRLNLTLTRGADIPAIPADAWGSTSVRFPDWGSPRAMDDAITGRTVRVRGAGVAVADLMRDFPIVVLTSRGA